MKSTQYCFTMMFRSVVNSLELMENIFNEQQQIPMDSESNHLSSKKRSHLARVLQRPEKTVFIRSPSSVHDLQSAFYILHLVCII